MYKQLRRLAASAIVNDGTILSKRKHCQISAQSATES